MPTAPQVLFADAGNTLAESVELGLTGLLTVIAILFILTGIISGLSLLFKEKSAPIPAAKPAPAPATTPATMATTATQGISPEHLQVVIAAAVHVALKSRPKTLKLGYTDNGWSVEGRRNIFQSRAMSTPRVTFKSIR